MSTDTQDSLPKISPLPGVLHLQSVKCGKANCRCTQGKPHRAYYRFWREGKKIKKAYVRKADVEKVKAACSRWAEMEAAKVALLNSPEGKKVRREVRAMMISAGASPAIIRRMGKKARSKYTSRKAS